MARLGMVVSHWYTLVDEFNTSTLEFYEDVKSAVRSRDVPDVTFSSVEFKEGGFASARRRYLRIERGNVAFDICGAPYGNGFFFSWWVSRIGPRFPFLYLLGFLFLAGVGSLFLTLVFQMAAFVLFEGLTRFFVFMVAAPVSLIPVVVALGLLARKGVFGPEEDILAIPIVGWIYEKLFNPITYYSLDTALMFQESIRRSVNDVIDALLDGKGLRALTTEEQKPTIRELGQR